MVYKIFFAPNSPIFKKSLDEERKQSARQLQSFMLYKQTQKALTLQKQETMMFFELKYDNQD